MKHQKLHIHTILYLLYVKKYHIFNILKEFIARKQYALFKTLKGTKRINKYFNGWNLLWKESYTHLTFSFKEQIISQWIQNIKVNF